MTENTNLSELIEKSRKISEDGSLVTYDLTLGLDFSNPALIARSLAEVFFKEDASGWFQVDGDEVKFAPTHKVRIVLSQDHGKMLENVIDDFLKDMKIEELPEHFAAQIRDETDESARLKAKMVAHSLTSSLFSHSEKKVLREYITDDLLVDLLGSLEIRTLSGQDLIDWKNLPI